MVILPPLGWRTTPLIDDGRWEASYRRVLFASAAFASRIFVLFCLAFSLPFSLTLTGNEMKISSFQE